MIENSTKSKIQPIKELENELLKDSNLDDMRGVRPDIQDPTTQLNADEVKHDISVLARYLIRVYVGWPVHNDIVKRKVLKHLTKAYNSAHDMTASELFDTIQGAIEYIPDNHISMFFNRIRAKTKSKRVHKDVGNNFAGIQPIKTELRNDGIAVIGFTSMLKTDEFRDTILDFQNTVLPKSTALIIDLRGNGGGNSFYSDRFAYFLCGKCVDSAKKIFVRTTPEAQKVQQESYPTAGWAELHISEKLQVWKKGKDFKSDKQHAYMKPIYILTDEHTGSGAEMFLLRMVHHPMVKVVGDNSRGMEVYGNMARGFLPHSKITVSVGMNYRILEHDNFELHGYKPNIKCGDRTDAMGVAIAEFNKSNKNTSFYLMGTNKKVRKW